MNRLLGFLIAIGVVNFVIFEFVGLFAGGTAQNGKIEGGHFYVGEHGHYTEVSKEFFDYRRMHGCTIWVTHPAAMGSILLLGIRKAKEDKRRERLLRRLNQLLSQL